MNNFVFTYDRDGSITPAPAPAYAPNPENPPTYAEALYSGPKMEVSIPNIPLEPSPDGQKPAPKRGWFPMMINGHEMIVMTKEDGVKAVEGLNAGIIKAKQESARQRVRAEMAKQREDDERERLGQKAYDAKVEWRRERARKAEARAKKAEAKAEAKVRKAERAYANAEAVVARWNRFWGIENA